MSKIVAIYVRVSTGKQADRDSIPFQIQECSNYVKHFLKTENFEVFKDAGRSGKNTQRPEYPAWYPMSWCTRLTVFHETL